MKSKTIGKCMMMLIFLPIFIPKKEVKEQFVIMCEKKEGRYSFNNIHHFHSCLLMDRTIITMTK